MSIPWRVFPAVLLVACSGSNETSKAKYESTNDNGTSDTQNTSTTQAASTEGSGGSGDSGGSGGSGGNDADSANSAGGSESSAGGSSGDSTNGGGNGGAGATTSTESAVTGAAGNGWSTTADVPPTSQVGAVGQTVPGEIGVWEKVDLPGTQSGDLFQSIANDPVRPSDFYYASGAQGREIRWWRSTDFGATWELINDFDMHGAPWGFSIDPNPNRDPETPPTLWAPAGYGDMGAWKSVDGGVSWQRSGAADAAFGPYNPSATDLYHIQILPDDPPNHVLATYHYGFKDSADGGIGETWDGGETWVVHPPASGMGTSHYVIPISATTWCIIAQEVQGIWRTTTAGRVGGTAEAKYRDGTISTEAWTKVDEHYHFHGSHQNIFADGAWYAAGINSLKKSTDDGATWQVVVENMPISALTATGNYFYGAYGNQPALSRAPRSNDTAWDTNYTTTPSGMTTGPSPFGMSAALDTESGHWVVLSGSWETGLWRYIEP